MYAYTSQVGPIAMTQTHDTADLSLIESNVVRCPQAEIASKMIEYIAQMKKEGDSTGGIITCVVKGVPVGLGEPVFDKLHARLATAMLSINAAHGFDYGSGFEGVTMKGSEANDAFMLKDGNVKTRTNHSGGVQGGISNGEAVYFRVLFKPVATIFQKQDTINKDLKEIEIQARGRRSLCFAQGCPNRRSHDSTYFSGPLADFQSQMITPDNKWAIIINLKSGKKNFRIQMNYLFKKLTDAGIAYEHRITEFAGHAVLIARNFAQQAYKNFSGGRRWNH